MDPNPNIGCKTNAQDQGPKLNEIEGCLEAKEKALSQIASHSAQELINEMLPSFSVTAVPGITKEAL